MYCVVWSFSLSSLLLSLVLSFLVIPCWVLFWSYEDDDDDEDEDEEEDVDEDESGNRMRKR